MLLTEKYSSLEVIPHLSEVVHESEIKTLKDERAAQFRPLLMDGSVTGSAVWSLSITPL